MSDDIGLSAVDGLFQSMQIDEWSVREERGYTWWGKDLAQRVTATEPEEDDGCVLSTVTVQTEVLADVPIKAETVRALAWVNAYGCRPMPAC
jgi:hypothetical protein